MVKSSNDFLQFKDLLDRKARKYESKNFIETDPIKVAHQFSEKADIEIISFLITTFAWGNRKSIINSANNLVELLESNPHDFVVNHTKSDLKRFKDFTHRTFQPVDLIYFITALKFIYTQKGGLENVFVPEMNQEFLYKAIHRFKRIFFGLPHLKRTEKHISDPLNGSASKRINLFLRWMVRSSTLGVDFGIWKNISPRILSCPLDIHTLRVAGKLGLISRKTNDFKTLVELDRNLRLLNPEDPVKYDFALFGLGMFENI